MTFTATGTFTAGNTFTIQLSNAAGSFAAPVTIGAIANILTTAQTVTTTIPNTTVSGTGYRIRVVADGPATTSAGTSAALTIVSNPTVGITPTTAQSFVAGGSGSLLTATEAPAAGNTRVWQSATTSGGPYTDISPAQTGLTYTPSFATAGTYYVVATSTFAACAAVTSNEVTVTVSAPPTNAINTPTYLTAPVCASTAAALDVAFTATGPYSAGNTFTIQLSDAAGSFAAPVTIGAITNNLTTAQTVTTTIPAGTATGTGYRIQVVSDNPTATSAGPSAAFTIVSNPTVSIAPTTTQAYAAGSSGSLLTATESFATGTNRVWQVSSTSGGPFLNISPAQSGPTYTPAFATAGTYFVRVLSTFAACAAVPSNEVEIDVTNPVPTITGISPSLAIAGSPDFTLTITGASFLATSTATFNGVSRVTTFVSATQLKLDVLAADIATAGSYNVAVTNAGPGGGTTAAAPASTFTVTPQPTGTACLTQGFESVTFPPTGWLAVSTVRSGSAGDIKTGSGAAIFGSNNGSLTTVLLVNPNLLTFALGRSTNSTAKSLVVEVSTTTQTGTFTALVTYDHNNVPSGSYDVYSVDLSAYSASPQVWVRFRKASSTTSPWRLDDVNVYCNTAPTPEIDVTQGATPIASGGSYAYANTVIATNTDATFTIANPGTGALNISNIALSNNAGGAFSIQTSPLPTTVAASGSTPLVVRFAPTVAGAQTATLTISNDDSNEGTYLITLTGQALATEPVVPQPTASVSNITAASADITVAGGTGTRRLVVVRATGSPAVAPLDGTTYTASLTYGSALATGRTGTGNYVVVADGSSTTFTVSGLSGTTGYTVDVYAYNDGGTVGAENYLSTMPGTASFTTPTPPAGAAQAGVLLFEDDFNSPAGTLLTTTGWTAHSAAGTGGPISIDGTNQSFSEYPIGQPGDNNRALSAGTGEDINHAFTTPAGASTLYVAGIINLTVTGNDYFLHLMDNTQTSPTVFRGRVFTRNATGGFNFGLTISDGSQAAATYGPAVYTVGQNYLVVLKYVTNAGGNDEASLYVFDAAAPSTEPGTPTVGPLTEANSIAANSLNAVALRQNNNTPNYYLDGVRVATGWGSVIGKPVFTGPAATLAPGNYYNVVVNNADQVSATGAVRIENNLTLTTGKVNTSSTNSLTLYESATTTGGSTTSFVNGPLARITGTGAATSVFPVGKGAFYRPITLVSTAQGVASTYTAEHFEGNSSRTLASGNGLGTAPLARVSSKRFYTVTSSNTTPGNFTGTITLSFGAEDYVNVPSSSDFVIGKRDATGSFANQWTNLGRSGNTGTDAGPGGASVDGTLTSALFSDFSDFTLGAQNDLSNTNVLAATNPLPVELTAFTAQRQPDGGSVILKWATATERNSARFEVQRSTTGREFSTIATVAAAGTSNQPTSYASLDKTAPAAATFYYRLRQVDRDGTFAFSPVATMAGNGVAGKVLLFPNPAQRAISFIAATATPYRVLNQLGQSLLSGITEAGTARVSIEQLPAGLYFLELQTATGRAVQKFEKE